MKMRPILLAVSLATLAACTSQAERMQIVHDQCAGYGYHDGSQDMAECQEREYQSRRAKGLALVGMGTGMMSAGAPQQAWPVTCSTIHNSSNTTTTVCP